MFGRTKKQPAVFVVIGLDGVVHSAGNPGLSGDWDVMDLAEHGAANPGEQCLVWAGDVFSPMRVMGETAASLELQFGPPDAVANR
jgi:hypothetical protein